MAIRSKLCRYRIWMVAGLAIFAQTICNPSVSLAETDDSDFQKLDTNNDGVLSGTEAKTVRKYDTDGDGEVTKAEYQAGIANEQKKLLAIDDDKLFAERDMNEDGVLSGKEIRGFEKYDSDGDGEVSREEYDQGRKADRGGAGGMTKEEHDRLALEQFRKLDINEDGRLSGKEMKGYENLDSNGDRRISEAEFVEGYQVAPSTGELLTIFLMMLNSADSTDFLKAAAPAFAKDVDAPILNLALGIVSTSLGKLKPSAADGLVTSQEVVNNVTRTIYKGKLEFTDGSIGVTLIVSGDQILGFELKAPVLDDFNKKLHQALFASNDYAKLVSDFYTPRCEEFITLILAGNNEKAFGKYHPEVQKQIGLKKAQSVFAILRGACGDFKALELESAEVQFDGNGNGEGFKITHLVHGSKGDYFAATTFQFIGLSGHIVGLSVKKANIEPEAPVPVAPVVPAPAPPRIKLNPPTPPTAAPAPPSLPQKSKPSAPAPAPAPAAPAAPAPPFQR